MICTIKTNMIMQLKPGELQMVIMTNIVDKLNCITNCFINCYKLLLSIYVINILEMENYN